MASKNNTKNDVNNNKSKSKKHFAFRRLMSIILIITSFITLFNVFKNGYFSLFYDAIILVISLFILYIFVRGLNSKKLRGFLKFILGLLSLIIIILEIIFLNYGTRTILFLQSLRDDGTRITTYGIYVRSDSSYESLSDLENKTINYMEDESVYKALDSIKDEVSIKSDKVSDIDDLLTNLFNSKCDSILLNTSYESIIQETNSADYDKLRKIKEISVRKKISIINSDTDLSKQPFVVYISGEDSNDSISSSSRSDVNIILAVNPICHRIGIVSTPRDSYVKLNMNNKYDKLTHAGIYGVEESMNTLKNLYNIDIDYYVKVNFTSFIDVVDTIGGVDVNVEKNFCESNQYRSVKKSDQICLSAGEQTLNGQQALAYARNRHAFSTGDIARGNHQMEIVNAMIKKMSDPSMITKYNKILSELNGNVLTNISSNSLSKLALKELGAGSDWNIESFSPSTNAEGELKKCYSTGDNYVYVLILDDNSVNEISSSLKEILST